MEKREYIDEVIDLENNDQLRSIIKLLKSKSKVIFDRTYFRGDVVVRKDWRTKLLIKVLEYIVEEKNEE